MIDLSGKTAIVTGSTGGIGFAIAEGLLAAGASVVISGRTQERVDAALGKLRESQPRAQVRGVAANLATAEGCQALIEAEPKADVLVNNLGVFKPKDFFDIPDEDWTRFLDTNIMSGVRLSRAYLNGMAEQGWGRVIFISSESALNIPVEMIHYGVTKTALLGLSRGLAKRMAGTNVTVNAILPGPTLSDGVVELMKGDSGADLSPEAAGEAFVAEHRPSSIIRRASTVTEVANMVVYIASPLASATTGAALRVDGGVINTIA